MIFNNQLRYAVEIVDAYKGEIPLHAWLKDYFRAHKQMGSRDRRQLSALVYSFYRLGHAVRNMPAKDRLLTGLYVCTDQPSDLLRHFRPDWDPGAPLAAKLEQAAVDITAIFPWKDELSPDVDHADFCRSFLVQPALFLRIRPGYKAAVLGKLQGISHEVIEPATIRLPNGFNVESYFTPDHEIVIQDYSSQQIADYLMLKKDPGYFWDACAASGGKSILAFDLYPQLHITASDIRASIIKNLRARFTAAGIRNYLTFLADLSTQEPPASAAGADLILADVPCTGSGTWSRTPESLYFFDPSTIEKYRDRQRAILRHIAPQLSPGASLVYCTCSVFKKENEEMTDWIRDVCRLRVDLRNMLIGYPMRADTLFATRFVGHSVGEGEPDRI